MLKKKSLGQVFLKDQNVINNIIYIVETFIEDNKFNIIEIGPGTGALTEKLYTLSYDNLYLVEKDDRLIKFLNKKYTNAIIINEDAVSVDYSNFLNLNHNNILVSNLPYYASSKILNNIVEQYSFIDTMVLMFQKELADRITAKVNTKEYSRITLLADEFYETKKIFNVNSRSFKPVPKVDSSVLTFKRRSKALINPVNREVYEKTLERMFQHRRKKISYFFKCIKVDTAFLDIDLNKRVGELDIYSFEKIANFLSLVNN